MKLNADREADTLHLRLNDSVPWRGSLAGSSGA